MRPAEEKISKLQTYLRKLHKMQHNQLQRNVNYAGGIKKHEE